MGARVSCSLVDDNGRHQQPVAQNAYFAPLVVGAAHYRLWVGKNLWHKGIERINTIKTFAISVAILVF